MTKPKGKTLLEVFKETGVIRDDGTPNVFFNHMKEEQEKTLEEMLLKELVNLIPILLPGSSFIFEYNKRRIEINVKNLT